MNQKKPATPPALAMKLFRWFCKPAYHLDIEGDLVELFEIRQEEKGLRYARWVFYLDVLLLFRPGLIRPIRLFKGLKSPTMFKHHFKLGWRLLLKNKGYSLVNIGGLALGMAVAMLMALWIKDEINYDTFHAEADQIYTVKRHVFSDGEIHTSDRVTFNIANTLKTTYPSVEEVAITTYPIPLVITQPEVSFRESGIYATPSFFDIFSWKWLQGDTTAILASPNSILISASLAQKYFGREGVEKGKALGQLIAHNTEGLPPFMVTGIFEDIPSQSSLQFDFVLPMKILLIVGALTVHQQINYIQSKNLGLDRENVIYLRLEGPIGEQYNTLKEDLLAAPGVAAVSATSSSPLEVGSNTHSVRWQGKDPAGQVSMHILSVNFDFIDLMKMDIVDGRDFDVSYGTDSVNYIINETALKTMGFDDPLGQQLSFWGNTGNIVGVVKDFHMSTLYSEIEPTIIQLRPRNTYWLYLRTEAGRTAEAISSLETAYERFNTDYPFEYQFLDESFRETYRSEHTIGTLSYYFTGFALFIACLGLIGLAVYTGQRRMKEISVRKVMGASLGHLVFLLSKDFMLMIFLAFLLASPLAYFLMEDWLSHFAYRIPIGLGVFIWAGTATFLIALLTVGFYIFRIAISNPVQALKSE